MTSERDIVLSGIRRSLGRSPEAVRSGAAARHEGATDGALATGAPHPAPSRVANASQAELIDIFIAQLESQGVRAVRCPNDASVPRAVADVLEEFGLDAFGPSQSIRMGSDPWLRALDWSGIAQLTIDHGAARMRDTCGLSRGLAGIAEAGSVVLASGAENPVTLAFVPPAHIAVVAAADIVASYDNAWSRLRTIYPDGLPRTVNLIAGPSRTADIGGRPVLGAHGPKHLAVIVVGAAIATG